MVDLVQQLSLSKEGRAANSKAVIMRSSRALGFNGETSKQLFPRVIVVRGQVLMGFTPDKNAEGHNAIEIVEFLTDSATFAFREITLQNGEAECVDNANTASNGGLGKCTQCHSSERGPSLSPEARLQGVHPRPIMPNFHFAAFGGLAGRIRPDTLEFKEFADFAARVGADGTGAYAMYSALGQPSFSREGDGELAGRDYVFPQNGAEILRAAIEGMNAARVVRHLSDQSSLDRVRPALLGALLECRDFASFFPEDLALETGKRVLSDYPFKIASEKLPKAKAEVLEVLTDQMRQRMQRTRRYRYLEESLPEREDEKVLRLQDALAAEIDEISPLSKLARIELSLASIGLSAGIWSTETDGPRSAFRFTGNGRAGTRTELDRISCALAPEMVRVLDGANKLDANTLEFSGSAVEKDEFCQMIGRKSVQALMQGG